MAWIGPQFLETVVFLFAPGQSRPSGTAFLVNAPPPDDPNGMVPYLLTARHNLEEAQRDTLVVRFNQADGAEDVETARDEWVTHDNADVAALMLTGTLARIAESTALRQIPTEFFVNADGRMPAALTGDTQVAGGLEVGVGDEIFITGLFSLSAGTERNLPVARFGRIARMPDEDVPLSRWGGTSEVRVRAYLGECLSWGGVSGSPVFVRRQTVQMLGSGAPGASGGLKFGYHAGLLGLMSAHFDVSRRLSKRALRAGGSLEASANAREADGSDGTPTNGLEFPQNSGIAVITPAASIYDLLFRADVIAARANQR